MTTVRDIITDALREINVISLEETPTAAQAQDALTKLKRMLAAWATDSLVVFARTPQVLNLIAGQGTYTIGAGGDFNIPRPARISEAYMRSPDNYDYPVLVSNDYTDYSVITSKTSTSTLPIFLYNDNQAPLQNIYLWPVPSTNVNKLVIWTTNAIGTYTTLDDIVTLPDGYEEAIVSNLAMRLAIPYAVATSPELQTFAVDSKAVIMRNNYQGQLLMVDTALTREGMYDIVTDKPVGRVN